MLTRTHSGYKAIKEALTSDSVVEDVESGPTNNSGVTHYLVYVIFIATFGPLLFGYHLGELNAPQKVIICPVEHNPVPRSTLIASISLPQCIPMSAVHWGLVQSIFTVGGLLGALVGGATATKYGRLFSMRSIAIALLLGASAEAFSTNVVTMVLGRWFSGIGAGAATVVCPIYIAEVSPIDKRGLFGSASQVMINLGILISQVLGYLFSQNDTWRVIFGFAGFLALFMLLGLMTVSETPQWLADSYRTKDAQTILRRLRGPHANIQLEIRSWNNTTTTEQTSLLDPPPQNPIHEEHTSVSIFDVIMIAKYRRAVIGVTATMMAQQLCGINSVFMYSVAILGAILPSSAALLTVMVSGMNVLMSVFCAPLADFIGRKPSLLLSIGGMGINSIFLAIGLSQNIASLTIIGLVLFVCSFSIGLGPIPFILASELTGPEAVGAVSSWALAGSWISTFCVAQFFPMLNGVLSRGQVYWVFAGLALGFGMFIAWWVPETKGKASPDEAWAGSSISLRRWSNGFLAAKS